MGRSAQAAPISPGSSGSPVLDENGEVIGVATLTNSQGQNLNFAIASSEIRSLVRGVWCDEHPEACEMLGGLVNTIREAMTVAQHDRAQSIIEKYLADRLAVRNDPTLDAAAKKEKLDQLGQEYDTNISDILTPAQKERFAAAEQAANKRTVGAK